MAQGSYYPEPPYEPKPPYGLDGQVPREDKGSFGFALLGFFFPVVGLILWLVWRDDRPGDSRHSRNGFIAAVISWAAFIVAVGIIAWIGMRSSYTHIGIR